MRHGVLLLLFAAGIVFAVSGGGGGGSGGGSSGPTTAVEIFITGSCVNQQVSVSVSVGGAAVSDAEVTITQFSRTRQPRVLTGGNTNANGVYAFTPNETASYQVTVAHPNYIGKSAVVNVVDCEEEANRRLEANLTCTDLETMRERLRCRINLPENVTSSGLRFLPEECRVLNGTRRAACITNYDFLQRCRHLENDSVRNRCYLAQVNLRNASADRAACGGNASCVSEVRERVFGFVKFRLYNLEEKVERLRARGLLTEDEAVEFIQEIEELKQQFNDAQTVEEKRAVIQEAQAKWERLRSLVVERIQAGRGAS